MQRAAGRLLAVSGGLIAVPLGFSSCSWCRTPGWGAAMPCAIWNPASCSGRSRCSVSSEGAEGSAAEPPTARRIRHSLQDTLASDGLRGGDGRYSELRASSWPTLPRPACKVGCSARCARPWHRKSSRSDQSRRSAIASHRPRSDGRGNRTLHSQRSISDSRPVVTQDRHGRTVRES